jgi:hypothetical protein
MKVEAVGSLSLALTGMSRLASASFWPNLPSGRTRSQNSAGPLVDAGAKAFLITATTPLSALRSRAIFVLALSVPLDAPRVSASPEGSYIAARQRSMALVLAIRA